MTNAAETLLALLKENMKIVFSVESEKFAGIFKDFLRDYDIFPKEIKKLSEIEKASISLYRKHISGGFIDKDSGYAVISDMDIKESQSLRRKTHLTLNFQIWKKATMLFM